MAAPTLVSNYPSDGDTGIPVGITLLCYFSVGVDLETIKNSIVLFGRDFDQTSGPDQALWIDNDTGNNKYWLASPGFKGIVPVQVELVYFDTNDVDLTVHSDWAYQTLADEVAAGAGHLVRITPEGGSLAPNTVYTLYINGDNETNNLIGVGARTVFDVQPGVGNTGTTGSVSIYGTWTGTADDEINIKITTGGDIGVAKYKWWYTSLGESSASTGKFTGRRFRKLDDGVQVRFTGSAFEVGDTYVYEVHAPARMVASSSFSFTTNDGSWATAPATPSTPAVSSPPATVLPSVSSDAELLSIISMTPENGSYNNKNSTRIVIIEFDDLLDADTITDTSVRVFSYPVSGHYADTSAPKELLKELIVDDATLTIKF